MSKKPVVLTFVGNYLPGYKAGGILRSVVNTVDHLSDEFDFRIVTRDRDLGEKTPYSNIRPNQWQTVGNASVCYFSPGLCTTKHILNIIVSTEHDILFLNSFFDSFTVKALWNRRLRKADFKPIVIAPRGEFAWASLKQKYPKKFVFIQAAKLLGLYDDVTWHASSKFEADDLVNVMKIRPEHIHMAMDLPGKFRAMRVLDEKATHSVKSKGLKIVFLSRISREKNLDYALKILGKVRNKVSFDIFGPKENADYWKECERITTGLPENITVRYLGGVHPSEVVDVMSRYDLFFLPSGGENYGHVIAEALTAGTPVLISKKTPWRDLAADECGWDIDLSDADGFVRVIENLAMQDSDELFRNKSRMMERAKKRLLQPETLETNRRLFLDRLL